MKLASDIYLGNDFLDLTSKQGNKNKSEPTSTKGLLGSKESHQPNEKTAYTEWEKICANQTFNKMLIPKIQNPYTTLGKKVV